MSAGSPLRVLVVDDEPPARRRLVELVRKRPALHVVGEAANGERGVEAIIRRRPELVFLDIQMPGMSGFEVVNSVGVERMPPVVFVTAYDQHALRAFDVHAVDYLLKPFTVERFDEAVHRAVRELSRRARYPGRTSLDRMLQALRDEDRLEDRILVRSPRRVDLVPTAEIDWVEAAGNYVRLHVGKKSYLLRDSLQDTLRRLEPHGFVRTHRSALVRVDRVRTVQPRPSGDAELRLAGGTTVPLSRRFRDDFERRFQR